MHITAILYWMGLHTQMFLFALLNADSNRTMWVQCITIRFWLQTEDLISLSKQVEMGINMNQHGQNIKSKGQRLSFMSFSLFLTISQTNSFTVLHKATIRHYFSVTTNAGGCRLDRKSTTCGLTSLVTHFEVERMHNISKTNAQKALNESDSYYIASSLICHSDFGDFHDVSIGLDC